MAPVSVGSGSISYADGTFSALCNGGGICICADGSDSDTAVVVIITSSGGGRHNSDSSIGAQSIVIAGDGGGRNNGDISGGGCSGGGVGGGGGGGGCAGVGSGRDLHVLRLVDQLLVAFHCVVSPRR